MDETKKIKILAIQLNSTVGNIRANCIKVVELVEKSIEANTDLIVLPEVWSCGWSPKNFQSCGENFEDSLSIQTLQWIAKKYNVNIVGGSIIEKTVQNEYYNTCPVINNKGEFVAKYRKIHLFSYFNDREDLALNQGQEPVLIEINGIKIGLSICYDIRFPELYRAYRKMGAEILINCAAWGDGKASQWECMTKSRASENQAFMIAVNQCEKIDENGSNLGHTRIIDFNGNSIVERLENSEGSICAELKLNDLYQFRKDCTILKDIKEVYEVKCV